MQIIATVAVRYLVARARQSLLTVGGIVLGVVALILTQGMMGGFKSNFVNNTLGSSPHVMVRRKPVVAADPTSPSRTGLQALQDPFLIDLARPPVPDEEERMRAPENAQRAIREVAGVAALAPLVSGQVMFGFHGNWEPLTLNGILPSAQARVVDFASKVRLGTVADLERDQNGVILGQVLADRMRVRVGDRVQAWGRDGNSVGLRVVGLYNSRMYDLDNSTAFVNLRRGQSLLDLGGAINAVQVRCEEYLDADAVARRIEHAVGMKSESWMEANRNTLSLLNMLITIQFLVAAFTMLVAGFGIAGNLITTVSEKTFDIGVLKSMGMSRVRIGLIFLLLAAMLMAIGVSIGLGLAYWLVNVIARLPSAIKPQPGVFAASETFPMVQEPSMYVVAAVFALVVSLGAGLSPALRAARLEPLGILRSATG